MTPTVADFVSTMDAIAPVGLAQEWDNVGLLAGDPRAPLRRAMLCIDLTPAVVDEAIRARCDLVMAYHPPIFKPIHSLRADSGGMDSVVFRCIASGIGLYSTHTALDAADGGTNEVIASLCGITRTEPLEYVDDPSDGRTSPKRSGAAEASRTMKPGRVGAARRYKLVVFVPTSEVDNVADAMFQAGAGQIGDYSRCSFRLDGEGTFFGGASTHPTIGQSGRMEFVHEVRLETAIPARVLPDVIGAMIQAHPYEEPAFDIYPLQPPPVRGIGRVGLLPAPLALGTLARKLKRSTRATCVQIVGETTQRIERAIIVVGAAGSLPLTMREGRGSTAGTGDVIITGEIRHHDALTIRRRGASAIALGHWASERPVLSPLAERIHAALPSLRIIISDQDADPFSVP